MAALEDLIAQYQKIVKALKGESIEKYSAIAVGKVAYLSVVSAWFNNMYSIPRCDEYYQERKWRIFWRNPAMVRPVIVKKGRVK
mgnify:FL=1